MQHTRAPNTELGAAPLWTSAFGQANQMRDSHHTSQHLKLLRGGLHVLQQYGQQSVDPGGWRLSLASLALITVLLVSKWIWFHIKRNIHACHCLPHLPTWSWKEPLNNLYISNMPSLVSRHVTWCIHHSVNHCTSVLCEMQCYYAHKMSMVILVLAIYLYWSARRSQHKVIVIALVLVHMKIYSVLIGAHCRRALSDPFSTFLILRHFAFPNLVILKTSRDISWVFGYNQPVPFVSHCFCTWHGRNDMEWYSLRYRQCFLRESWELPPHVSKESPLSKHCRIASDCSLRFQLKTKRWSWRLWEMKLTCIRLLKLLTFLNHPNSIKHWWHCMHLFCVIGFCQQQIATWTTEDFGALYGLSTVLSNDLRGFIWPWLKCWSGFAYLSS